MDSVSTIFTAVIFLLATTARAAPTSIVGSLEGSERPGAEAAAGTWLRTIVERYVNDPSAGEKLGPGAWGAIIGGAIGVLLLVAILIFCARNGRWPAVGKGESRGRTRS